MLREFNRRRRISAFLFSQLLVLSLGEWTVAQTPPARPMITELRQLTEALTAERRVFRDLRLEVTVCAASRPEIGTLIVQDETGVELLQIGNFEKEILPGEKIRIQGWRCLLRRRDLGIELSTGPVIDNDGLHMPRTWGGHATLREGLVPFRLDWFNNLRTFHLETFWFISNSPPRNIEWSNLWHVVTDGSGRTNLLPGLRADYYEGYWEAVPDFDLLKPVRTEIATSFDLEFRPRDEMVAVRFTGYLNVPLNGRHLFRIRSDDGSLLFLGKPELPVVKLGFTNVPTAKPGFYGEALETLWERRWTEIEGRVGFVTEKGRGFEFDLCSDRDVVSVRVADAMGLEPARLMNSRVRIRGVSRGVLTLDQRIVLGRIYVASSRELDFVGHATASDEPSPPIRTMGKVQSLPIGDAGRALPVRLRGVVTDARNSAYDHWMSLQDDTRGIFVNLRAVSTNGYPAFGQLWEIEGHSAAGDFAPIVIAEKITLLGEGRLPEPVRPTWTELLNGSMDVQWAELQGLVTAVQGNHVTLLLPEGRLDIELNRYSESELKPFEKTIARIRGVLYAEWNPDTREVRVGSVVMRNATICVNASAPADPFDAVLKTPRELLLFDAQATAFRRVKVQGQVSCADPTQVFVEADGMGLRLLPAEKTTVRPGDLVEAVGYPDIGRSAPLLREVLLRKTGVAPLPVAKKLAASELTRSGLDSTRVLVEGKLLGLHLEQGSLVLEMQSGAHLYLARLTSGEAAQVTLRIGSRLLLEGVYVSRGPPQRPNTETGSFELLLSSPTNIGMLSQPSWWTLQRLLILVGILLVVLIFSVIWITQLRRLVEQRTNQLQTEIRERELVERKHALEAERARIARDLHDDLGSSLTEISVLASTGLRDNATTNTAENRPVHPGDPNRTNLFHTIAGKARRLIAALDVIVWAVDPEDNSLQSLADYLTGYAAEFFSHTNIACRFKVPVSFPGVTLDGRVRHDLLMVVKETLNNIVRHAIASEVEFRMAISSDDLRIDIADNGKGFQGEIEKDGHGLKNLSARLTKLGGRCTVESRVGGGTTVQIRLPLPAHSDAPTPQNAC